jgi:chaperonin GroEL (HSP60 family)
VKEAYISFGAMDAVPDDADCVAGEEITVQIDVWSRKTGKLNCQAICKAVKDALHLQPLTLSENAIVEVELILRRIFTDQDGLTTHGALQFRVAVEEAE